MKQHNFGKNFQYYTECKNCKLRFDVIRQQMDREGKYALAASADDDCELRQRKNQLKAFW